MVAVVVLIALLTGRIALPFNVTSPHSDSPFAWQRFWPLICAMMRRGDVVPAVD